MKVQNAKSLPVVYYGLHMVEGVAEYPEHKTADGKATRILILENACKAMDPTFTGCPVYVKHRDEVDLENLQRDADGYVIRSFFNQFDGKHWAEFLAVSDAAKEAIAKGWKLSNAYNIKDAKNGGQWHAVEYNREVTRGAYDHLALVPNPRYAESIILTPEQFKEYNSRKDRELKALANSKERKSMFNFFTKKKLENAEEFETASVVLSNGAERTIKQLVEGAEKQLKNEADAEKDKDKEKMANGDDMVDLGNEKITVNALVEKYKNLMAPKDQKDDEKDKDEKKENALKAEKEAADKAAADKIANEKKEADEKAKKEADAEKQKNFDALKNAGPKSERARTVETADTKVARGQSRYGS